MPVEFSDPFFLFSFRISFFNVGAHEALQKSRFFVKGAPNGPSGSSLSINYDTASGNPSSINPTSTAQKKSM
jgi:hypothetical protein